MAEILQPGQTEYVAIPRQEAPVATPRPQGADRLRPRRPAAPPNPFRQRQGPPIIILPHDPGDAEPQAQGDQGGQQPVQQKRGRPVRFAAPQDHEAMHRAILANIDDQAPKLVYADMLDESGWPHMARAMREGAGPLLDGKWLKGGREIFGYPNENQWISVGNAGASRHKAHPDLGAYLSLWRHRTSGDLVGSVEPVLDEGRPGWPKQLHGGYVTTDINHLRGLMGEMSGPWNQISSGEFDKIRQALEANGPERFAAAQAPAGGMIQRGIYAKGGQFVAAPMPAPPPAAPPAPRRRTRLRDIVRRASTKMARPHIDKMWARAMMANHNDYAPWGQLADHVEDSGMPHLGGVLRSEDTIPLDQSGSWNPGESWERTDYLDGVGFPAWSGAEGKMLDHLTYWPAHGIATARIKVYNGRVNDPGNPERVVIVRGHQAVRDLAHEMYENQMEDGEGDWAMEFARIRDEADRQIGRSHAQG